MKLLPPKRDTRVGNPAAGPCVVPGSVQNAVQAPAALGIALCAQPDLHNQTQTDTARSEHIMLYIDVITRNDGWCG